MEIKKIYEVDNIKLSSILNIVNDESKEISIICHARASSKDARTCTTLALEFGKLGLNTIRFDFRGYGESTGLYQDQITTNFIKDLECILDNLISEGFNKFNLIGLSLGGKIVSLVDFKKYKINTIILWYPALLSFKNKWEVFKSKMFKSKDEKEAIKNGFVYELTNQNYKTPKEYFSDDRKYIPIENIKNANCPICIIHAKDDIYVSHMESLYIANNLNIKKNFHILQNGGHSFKTEESLVEAIKISSDFILDTYK